MEDRTIIRKKGRSLSLAMADSITTHTASDKTIIVSKGYDDKFKVILLGLRRREITGAFQVALAAAQVMKIVVSSSRWTSPQAVMERVQEIGKMLVKAQPLALVMGNIVRRVMFIIREEYVSYQKNLEGAGQSFALRDEPQFSTALYKMLAHDWTEDYSQPYNIKAAVQSAVGELVEDISNLYRVIADQATQHIHANEVIMTFGLSHTVLEFFKAAARKRKFEVIVAESAPSYTGRETAIALSKEGVDVTLIADSAVFAMMARVNKVIVGAHAVLANGGLVALTGTHALALAAKHHEVPLSVCVGLYKLCPLYPTFNQDSFNSLNSPNAILKFEEASGDIDQVNVQNPAFDYVPPELISLFITNQGAHSPSYIYRLLAEYYHPSDYQL
eukprot:TRINITY_DN14003_c0_g1_i1.p1 TRINITY_DN14003_c0_g1~~TRINITY_DN14003_c0_g1_i1.p1  ORF type:complete len:388 (+),score=64.52 TRINITY_DN14003_c0_g1_i1:25-1188(+)